MAKKIDINDVDYKTFLPCMDGVLLKRDKGEEKTESGIFYAREVNKQTGTVIAVGEDDRFEKSRIKPGAKVYFIEKDYMPIGDFILIKMNSIIGVFE
jgi:co-chaperonin GroES (HSP10)